MTNHVKIHGIIPRIQYTANGTLTKFDFPFAIFSSDDIDVYLGDTKQASTAYSVSGIQDSDGGSVTFSAAPADGTVVTIVRNLSIERTSDFQEGGALRADTLNDELDYQIACQQQIADNLNRSMVLPPYAVNNNLDLTLPMPSAGKAIVWNSDGTNLENSTVEVNALENALKSYKESAESAASTAITKAGLATDAADTATAKAQIATDKAAEATAATNNKANKDMDNLSSTGIERTITFVLPDFENEVAVANTNGGFTYKTPSCGFLKINNCAADGQCAAQLYKGTNATGTKIGTSFNNNIVEHGGQWNCGYVQFSLIPVGKDENYFFNSNNVARISMTFVPMKGVANA